MVRFMNPVTRMATAPIPTRLGIFHLNIYDYVHDDEEHMALVYGEVIGQHAVLARVHSECFTGDVMGSRRCDCGEQLQLAMRRIVAAGRGVIVYLRQEGRGIGLLDKLRAYNLQDAGFDTVDANLMLGHEPDLRDYRIAAFVLRDLGVRSVRLLTNNPEKIASLQAWGVTITEREALQIPPNEENVRYLATKALRMNHLLNWSETAPTPADALASASPNSKAGSRSLSDD